MIKFSLICDDEHGFEAWFPNGDAYEAQRESGALACPVCGSSAVRKALMAPAVRSTKGREAAGPRQPGPSGQAAAPRVPSGRISDAPTAGTRQRAPHPAELKRQLLALRRMVESRCDYVGDRFAEMARAMHDGEAETAGIYGEATPEELEALHDDGIAVGRIPWVREDA